MSSTSLILTAILILGASPILIFYLTRFVTRISKEANLPHYPTWVTPLALTAWFLSANVVGYFSRFSASGLVSPIGLFQIVIPMLVVISTLFLAKPATRLLERIPPDWLISIQVYRVEGFLLLYLYFHDGFVAKGFAMTAGIGDVLIGLSSLLIARWVRARARGYLTAAIVWNIAGIIDLVLAPVSARLSGFQGITSYPLDIVPLFLGPPLGIFLHVASLRNLYLLGRRGQRAAGDGISQVGKREYRRAG